jgi:hypothetical protein
MTPALALALLAGAAAAGSGFTTELPGAIGDISSWEQITGDVTTRQVAARYVLYVNPARQGLYQVIRYRIVPSVGSDGPQWRRSRYEKLVFNERPGRAHLRCFERIDDLASRAPHWRELSHGTDDYRWEMHLVMQLMQLHRSVRLGEDAR